MWTAYKYIKYNSLFNVILKPLTVYIPTPNASRPATGVILTIKLTYILSIFMMWSVSMVDSQHLSNWFPFRITSLNATIDDMFNILRGDQMAKLFQTLYQIYFVEKSVVLMVNFTFAKGWEGVNNKIVTRPCYLSRIYRQTSNISNPKSQNLNFSRLVLQLSLCNLYEARCWVENEDVVGAAHALITSEWTTISLPTEVALILEVW